MTYAIFNHKLIKSEEICISPQDRGFRYGDGVFDTLIVSNGKIYQYNWHIERLERGLQAIKIKFDITELKPLCERLLQTNNIKDGLLRIQITRGISGRGYLPNEKITPTLLIETMAMPVIDKSPISLWQSKYSKISSNALPVQFKLCQGLNSTLARMEAAENNCFDALMLNENNEICETSSANIFWLKNGDLYTPSLSCGALEGSVRAAIIRLWQGKLYEVAENIETLKTAQAVFITNVAWKVIAVSELKFLNVQWKSDAIVAKMLDLLGNDIKQLE